MTTWADGDGAVDSAGPFNLRDLGAYRTAEGRPLIRGLVFRAEFPQFAIGSSDRVRELGLRTVVDLRSRRELEVDHVDWDRHRVRHVRSALSAGDGSWLNDYTAYLVVRPSSVTAAVREILDPANHPVLFHCAAGKDRTGVIAALVLGVLGVAPDTIVADYSATAANLAPVLGRLQSRDAYTHLFDGLDPSHHAPRPEVLEALLRWLDERGGAAAWLQAEGISSGEIDAFRHAMTSEEEG